MRVVAFIVVMFCLSSCITPSGLGEKVDHYYDQTTAAIGSLRSGIDSGLEAVSARREVEGVPSGEDLDWKEWLIIIGAIGSSVLGVNTIRDRKYVRQQINGRGNGVDPEG